VDAGEVAGSGGSARTRDGAGKGGGSAIRTARLPASAAPTTSRPMCSGFIALSDAKLVP
jgi:hypothetical protein